MTLALVYSHGLDPTRNSMQDCGAKLHQELQSPYCPRVDICTVLFSLEHSECLLRVNTRTYICDVFDLFPHMLTSGAFI